MTPDDIRLRQMTAFESRRKTGLTDKAIALAIGRHPDTVGNWRTGATLMSVADLWAVAEFFAAIGDYGFVAHIVGDFTARRYARAAQLEAEARRLRAEAEGLEDVA